MTSPVHDLIERMSTAVGHGPEEGHIEADHLLVELIRRLAEMNGPGIEESGPDVEVILATYESFGKWYA